MKRFIKNYGLGIFTLLFTSMLFFTGFFLGRYGRSAASLDEIETSSFASHTSEETLTTTTPEQVSCEQSIPTSLVKPETTMWATVTAYCPCENCSEGFGRMTATGTTATAGRTIAVDPSVIPYGTEVIIDGQAYIAEDCGGAINGTDIDIFFDTHEEVENFGKQNLKVVIER